MMNIYQEDGFKIERMIERKQVQKIKKKEKKENESFLVLLIEFVQFNKYK